jgi:glycosyltransferase involved in cell wall biosynthesis
MKICHTISSIDKNSGGTSTYLKLLTDSLLINYNIYQEIVVNNSESPLQLNNKITVNFIENGKGGFFKKNNVIENIDCDVLHANGLWQSISHNTIKFALKNNIPYIVSPHGMLEPWSLKQGKFKKLIALKLFQYRDIKNAACIHATAPMEVQNIRSLGFKNPIAMIPNGVNILEFPVKLPLKTNKPKKILFLSRIHVKKGIENLIEAWKLINLEVKKDWKIEIVGNGDENYIKSLKEKIVLENLTGEIEIKKPVFGEDKIKLFREASLFVLPTFSENFGIVIAEALASYTPVITTKGTPWKDLNAYKAGWWIDIGVAPLKLALENALNSKEQSLFDMGVNGRRLVEDKYSMDSVGKQMIELYEWILKKNGNKPKFIF